MRVYQNVALERPFKPTKVGSTPAARTIQQV